MELKKGDIVTCRKACIMSGELGRKTTTIGKSYSITELRTFNDYCSDGTVIVKNQFAIVDDQGDRHWFTIENSVYFSIENTIRLKKLKKLKDYEVG